MPKTEKTLLIPKYMSRFQCIGSSCEDTCCAGWNVSIDKASYKKYRKVKLPDLAKKLEAAIQRNRANPTDDHYATIRLSGCRTCPMLNEESLCEVQLQLGEEYLSTTCATYPRVTNVINGNYEMSATLSCPEAARLALLDPEPMFFLEVPSKPSQRFSHQANFSPDRYTPNDLPYYFWDLRVFSIELIQNRNYALTDRVLMLGLFYQSLQDLIDAGEVSATPQLIENYRTLIANGLLREAIQQIPAETIAQIKLLKELVDVRMHIGIEHKRYLDCLQTFLTGISFEKGDGIEKVAARYQHVFAAYYDPFMRAHSHILENYLVNYIFKNTFPFHGSFQVLDNYFSLALQYSLIKMHLIGMAGFYREKFSVDHVIALIQSFSRVVEHNGHYLQIAFDYLKKKNFASIAGMAIFLKNE